MGARPVRVGVYDNPPKVFFDPEEGPSGIFIDIITDVAKNEGWELSFVYGSWEYMMAGLENGDIDVLPDVAYSTARAEHLVFNTITVLPSWLQFYTLEKKPLMSFNALKGKTVAVLAGSVQKKLCEDLMVRLGIDLTIQTYTNYSESIDAVLYGAADALLASRFFSFSLLGKDFSPSPVILDTSTLHYAVYKGGGQETIVPVIDRYVMEYLNNPSSVYYQSIEKWLHQKPRYFLSVRTLVFLPVLVFVSGISVFAAFRYRRKAFLKSRDYERSYKDLQNALRVIQHNREDLARSFNERDTLLRELFHRTRNNMSIIISLMALKAETYGHREVSAFARDVELRIIPMQLAHDMLIQTQQLHAIDTAEYVDTLSNRLLSRYAGIQNRVTLVVEKSGRFDLSIDAAVPLGLVFSELLANSYQHAFTRGREGFIRIGIDQAENNIIIRYQDSGPGLSSDLDLAQVTTLGLRIIQDLVRTQLSGSIDFSRDNGFSCTIVFPAGPALPL
ncbi:MAG: transporter substrate-binding domain-containing protein [Spirochaetales bacterium]|nr:transporter substrate-binding domain-containing protein [Spirochaetales bacterium]